jgi:hypothetical protein
MIHITKSGFQCLDWDPELHKDVQLLDAVLVKCLRDAVTLVEEDVTLGDILAFVAKDELLRLFIGIYSTCDVLGMYQEVKDGVKPLVPENDIKYCTVAMDVEVRPDHKCKTHKRIETDLDFYGCGNDGKAYGLDLTSLAEIAALPFRLESNAILWHRGKDSDEREEGLEFTPTLLEILDTIFFDLSFYGSSTEKADVVETLQQQVKSIEDGTATLVPLDLGEESKDDE